jgi:hypothetical protein
MGDAMTFRHWLHEKWLEHLAEAEAYNQPVDYDIRVYFNKYKFWLKRIYRASQQGVKNGS